MTLAQLIGPTKVLARMCEILDIDRLARSLALSAWQVRAAIAPRSRPARVTFALAFGRNLEPSEWQRACDVYAAELETLKGQVH